MHSPAPTSPSTRRRMLNVFAGKALDPPPIWLMRQAGRYLPEYRATRAKAQGFLDLCYTPDLAVEVSLQPIRRYGFDAAILFSDILVLPHALGQKVWFVDGEGPRLDPIATVADLGRLDPKGLGAGLAPVMETVRRLRLELPDETALIGFCGAPWTVATYMVAGRGTKEQEAARLFAYRDPAGFERLIETVTEASIDYLSWQIEAGVDLVQIFDSWAGSLPEGELFRWVFEPTRRIVSELHRRHPGVPVIGFPRGVSFGLAAYATITEVDGLGCDTTVPLSTMASLTGLKTARTPGGLVVQGNLDPLLLVADGAALEERVDEILKAMAGRPFIFNLGHGITPEAHPETVARLVARVRGGA